MKMIAFIEDDKFTEDGISSRRPWDLRVPASPDSMGALQRVHAAQNWEKFGVVRIDVEGFQCLRIIRIPRAQRANYEGVHCHRVVAITFHPLNEAGVFLFFLRPGFFKWVTFTLIRAGHVHNSCIPQRVIHHHDVRSEVCRQKSLLHEDVDIIPGYCTN